MELDGKEQIMIRHYSSVFKSHTFDEYDVLGFLIVIRRLIRNNKEYKSILEFADLIAHRERDRGQAFNAIKRAIDNNYDTYSDKKTIKGYKGITEGNWRSEWQKLCKELDILYTKQLIDELTLCVCSLADGSIYRENGQVLGKMYVVFNSTTIALMTTEGKWDSLSVGFFVYKGISAEIKDGYGFSKGFFETRRVDDKLVLVTSDENIFFELGKREIY